MRSNHDQSGSCVTALALITLAAVTAAKDPSQAESLGNEQSVASRAAGEPIMAIVSLRDQRITVYDQKGPILRAPASSGQRGRETPAGIFSVIQKDAEHYSNMYDDAYMPHMQRLTWSGIALHGGPLPGYPASHGCIRMPYDFAERLFDTTRLGMRVIVAPTNVAPIAIDHPALFQPKPGPDAVAASAAADKAKDAASKADQARLAVATTSRTAAPLLAAAHAAENSKLKAEAQVAAAERAIASLGSPEAKEQAENAKAKASAQVNELEAQLTSIKAELQPKLDAMVAAREAARAAETARVAAAEVARKLARALKPVSVFISRETQRLYVRQAFQSILEVPVAIEDVDRPIGTHIFTVMERSPADAGGLQWSVVSLVGGRANGSRDRSNGARRRGGSTDVGEAISTDVSSAKAALDRIEIPQDTADRIAEIISPRSSLIISDEALSSETGDGTEFVVLMSGEPQGGIKYRRRDPHIGGRYDHLPYWRSPIAGPYSTWWR